jgi:CheY-like chemotaxis protein
MDALSRHRAQIGMHARLLRVTRDFYNGCMPIESPRLRILVADDDRDAVETLLELVRGEGHEVRGVYTGLDVLDSVRDFAPDAVLLDIGMPHISGYEVARELRLRYASARPLLIAITGRNQPGDRTLAHLAGFDHHLAKPYDARELFRLLRHPYRPRLSTARNDLEQL